ncbi:MAG: hypothetical protein RLZZ536_1995 [Planctomycetota bacterium]
MGKLSMQSPDEMMQTVTSQRNHSLLLRQRRTGRAVAEVRVTDADPAAHQLLQYATAAMGLPADAGAFRMRSAG